MQQNHPGYPKGVVVPADDIWSAHKPADPNARRTWRCDRPPTRPLSLGHVLVGGAVLTAVAAVQFDGVSGALVAGVVVAVGLVLRRCR